MEIKEKIQEIIDRRLGINGYEGCGHLQVVIDKRKSFEDILRMVEEYSVMRDNAIRQIDGGKGEFFQMASDDPSFRQKLELTDPQPVIERLKASIKECDRLEKRFSRDTINISVIGKARQGKSRLLQSISGLENDIIPADNGGDCTGAKSLICNAIGETRAEVSFFTEAELCAQVQKYLDVIDTGITLRDASSIPLINLSKIDTPDVLDTNKKSSLYEHLCKYVRHYNKYAKNLGTVKIVNDPSKIRNYVAQYSIDGTLTYDYLSVKEVKIYTEFVYSNAGKIMLVDTIGLGDTSIGLREKLIETMIDDSDAAILLRRPDHHGDGIREDDNELYDLINSKMGGRALDKWLFYILNVWDENKKSGDAMYDKLIPKLGKTLKAAFIAKVNCGNKKDVEDNLLLPLLKSLSENLEDVDSNLLVTANGVFIDAYNSFQNLLNGIGGLLSSKFRQTLNTGGMFDELYEGLSLGMKLEELNSKYKNHNQECSIIKEEIMKTIGGMVDMCPFQKDILDQLKKGTKDSHPDIVYNNQADYMRAAIIDQFDEISSHTINELQETIKSEIIEVLKSEEGGKMVLIPVDIPDDGDKSAWLKCLIEQKMDEFPILTATFNDVLNFQLHIEGQLGYKVCLGLEYLDPESEKFNRLPSIETSSDKAFIAEEIEQYLLNTIPTISDSIQADITSLLRIPYTLFYAHIRKLRDRIIYSKKGAIELKEFYRKNATSVWREEFNAIISKQNVSESLRNLYDQFKSKRNKSLFIIKLK